MIDIENLDEKIKALRAAILCINFTQDFGGDEAVDPIIATLIDDLRYDLLNIKELKEGLNIENVD